jgi:hypothetical protein
VPAVEFAVNTGEVATPLELVVAVFTPPAKLPLAPDEGAVNVTVTPLAGDPFVVTVATSGAANAVPTVALCGVPLVAAIDTTGVVVVVL